MGSHKGKGRVLPLGEKRWGLEAGRAGELESQPSGCGSNRSSASGLEVRLLGLGVLERFADLVLQSSRDAQRFQESRSSLDSGLLLG